MSKKSTKNTYKKYQEHFSNEVHSVIGSYVMWKCLQNAPADDEGILNGLNRNALSWVFIRQSLMVNMMMSIGRIFDKDKNSAALDTLISSCISDIDIFSIDNLRKRKVGDFHSEEQLNNFLEKAYQPDILDFENLKLLVDEQNKTYDQIYKPIRNKILAHTDIRLGLDNDLLWRKTKNTNFENLLNFLYDLDITLQQLYSHGVKPVLKNHRFDEHYYANDILSLLNKIRSF